MKEIVTTKDAPKAVGPYSQGIRAGNMIFFSGQLGLDPVRGKLAEGGIAAQPRQSLQNVQALLAAVGASVDNIVKTTVYLTDMADFSTVNAEYSKVFTDKYPARSCVAVKQLPLDGLVEIEVTVAL